MPGKISLERRVDTQPHGGTSSSSCGGNTGPTKFVDSRRDGGRSRAPPDETRRIGTG
jgi:hypothetical protein